MGGLDGLVGRDYGPFQLRLSAAKVAEYVDASGDEPGRWTEFAPPSYAGALLFVAAPAFFEDQEVAPYTRLLIHGEQQFEWLHPLAIDTILAIGGTVERVRLRSGVHFTTFVMEVRDADGRECLTSRSMFLMSDAEAPGATAVEHPEPLAEARGPTDTPSQVMRTSETNVLPPLEKSASRADLVRYAAASQDFNPVHWDHARAVEAGLGGVVVHGLLMAAWAVQAAARLFPGPDPMSDGRFRFKAPMAAGTAATVGASVGVSVDGRLPVAVEVTSAEGTHVTATIGVRG